MSSPTHTRSDVPSQGQAHAADISAAPASLNEAPPDGRMECGVCWYVYDPAVGDVVWQITSGVAFNDLPDHWRCPECDTEMTRFMPLDSTGAKANNKDDVACIVAAYQRVDVERMQDIPFRNAALQVEAVDFCDWGGEQIGVIISPWFMNLVLVPGSETDWSTHRHGDKVVYTLPSGQYEFVHGDLEGFGVLQTCSLMSPVGDLQDQDTARLVAEEIMRLMLVEGEPEEDAGVPLLGAVDELAQAPKPNVTKPISRRELLRGRRDKTQEED